MIDTLSVRILPGPQPGYYVISVVVETLGGELYVQVEHTVRPDLGDLGDILRLVVDEWHATGAALVESSFNSAVASQRLSNRARTSRSRTRTIR